MESLHNLLKIGIVTYLGFFSYILYQIVFYRQKRFLFAKTILYFSFLAGIIIYVSNQYDIPIFHIYILFYLLGLYLARKSLSKMLRKYNKEFNLVVFPLKLIVHIIWKTILIPPFIYWIKNKRKLHKYYKSHPNKKPKSIYELF